MPLHIAVILAGFTGVFGKLISLNEGLLVWYRVFFSAIWLFFILKLFKLVLTWRIDKNSTLLKLGCSWRIESVQPVIDMWAEAMASTGDPNIGLHSGLGNNPSVFGLLGYLMQSCRNMKDTYGELERYQEMVSGWIRYKIFADIHDCVLNSV